LGKSQELYKKAKKLIPGGTQLLSKRPEMFLPELWPAYYSRAKGCHIWDLDENEYTDMSYMGIGSAILGYADDDVDAAVIEAVQKGNMTTLNAPEEVELAEKLCELHPWASKVRYARSGGESMSIAVRIARAKTGKDVVLFCGYHGWHDWYLAANLADDAALDGHLLPGLNPGGVPRGLKGSAYPFRYNDTEGFLSLFKKYQNSIAAVVMEPLRNHFPDPSFVDTIRRTTSEHGVVLIVDEITAGWRLNVGGAHLLLDLEPDIAVFGKAISNGFPMGAIIGKSDVMDAAQDTFISSTYWTERVGFVASLATIEALQERAVIPHINNIGEKVQEGWKSCAVRHDIKIDIGGFYPLGHFTFDYEDASLFKTLFIQWMLERGFLATTAFYASYAHTEHEVEKYLAAVDEVFALLSKHYREGTLHDMLKTPLCHSGFSRLT
jgi:glutamate-1-semialdehyde 2,1-aminomutase